MQSLLSALNSPNGLIISILIGSFLIYKLKNLFLTQVSASKIWLYFLLYPGVVLHELSHAVFCLIFGVRIKRMKLFSQGEGFVEYESKRKNQIRDFFISTAPLVIGLLFLVLIYKIFSTQVNIILIWKIVLIYLGFSVFLSMFPSSRDIANSAVASILILLTIIVFRNKIFSHMLFNEYLLIVFCATIICLFLLNLLLIIFRKVWK